jgi:NAD(P)-dependent dehydrogenase (short-subunit alcohol dehydrogenase family)
MTRKTVLITGATDGVGRYVALKLAESGFRVLIHGRNPERAAELLEQMARIGCTDAAFYPAEFASLPDIRGLAETVLEQFPRLDLLINNAGIFTGPPGTPRATTAGGCELRFMVNYLSGFLLTRLLLPALRHGHPARIVNVASIGQQPIDFTDVMLTRGYSGLRAYRQSKLAQIMFTLDLAQELADTQVTVNCLHPATFMDTGMVRQSGIVPTSTVAEGGDAVFHVATAPELAGQSGLYFEGKLPGRAQAQAYDPEARAQLHALSLALVGLPN